MIISNSTYITFIEIALELTGLIEPYSSRFSKKRFTQQQLFILAVLKQKLKLSYDMLIEDMKTRTEILLMLGLYNLPHPSTVRKFVKRLGSNFMEKLLCSCIGLTRKKKLNLGIDATGMHVEDGSFHYRKRLGNACKVRKNVKLSIAVDTDKQLITASKIRKGKTHDNKDFMSLVKKSHKMKQIRRVSADKAYDSEENFRFLARNLNAKAAIAQRDYGDKRIPRNHRKYRNIAKRNFNNKEYHQRSKVETVFSVIKRLFGATLNAKEWLMQKKELLFRLLAYNIHRLVYLRRIS